jgi:Flp pilus assembly protein TadD
LAKKKKIPGGNGATLPGYLWILLLVVITAATWGQTLSYKFVYDDTDKILGSRLLTEPGKLANMLIPARYFETSREGYYRPVASATHLLDHAIFGMNPAGHHFSNLLFHLATVLLLYLFAIKAGLSRNAAFVSALLFSLHPMLTESVSLVSFRKDVLAGLLGLASMIIFLDGYDSSRLTKKTLLTALSTLLFILALFSKEMAITFPVILITLLVVRRSDAGTTIVSRESMSKYVAASPLLLTAVGWGITRFLFLRGSKELGTEVLGPLLTRFAYAPRSLVIYLAKILLPFRFNADYTFSYPESLLDISFFIPLLLTAALAALFILAWKKSPRLFFTIVWICLPLFPVLNIIPIYRPVAERYLYIPVMGFALMLGYLLYDYIPWPGSRQKRMYPLILTILLALIFGTVTVVRSRVWRNELVFWQQAVADSPGSNRAHTNLGAIYNARGEYGQALIMFKKALDINPKDVNAINNMGQVLNRQGDYDGAAQWYRKALDIDPGNHVILTNLAISFMQTDKTGDAEILLTRALSGNPDYIPARTNLGTLYFNTNRVNEALRQFSMILEVDHDNVDALYNSGVCYYYSGDRVSAARFWQKTLEIEPGHEMAAKGLSTLTNK